ncbi:MAG TPA: hypothetical protein VM219_03685 [Phycisphaerae bacterium]|nr:hypothetical protein [Phycisphaerae bacterium]HUX00388.1 hypothetical protein [Phycisphaerae bacterium]
MTALKRCPRCNRRLPLEAFWRNARSPDGRQSYCRSCMGEYQWALRKKAGGATARAAGRATPRTCLKCGRTFRSSRPKWENRRCPTCEAALANVQEVPVFHEGRS